MRCYWACSVEVSGAVLLGMLSTEGSGADNNSPGIKCEKTGSTRVQRSVQGMLMGDSVQSHPSFSPDTLEH